MAAIASQKLVFLTLTSVLALVTAQQPPPNYSYDALPETSFSCQGRVVGGYYADVEAGCQMFHVCGSSQRTSFRFLCPNNTVFDQQHLICANWFQVSCDRSTVLYARNFEIFKKDTEQEVEFNELDEEDLPALDDYDFDYQLTSSSGAGRFFGGGGRGGSRPATAAPVTRAPVTRQSVSRAPRRFDLTTAATTPRSAVPAESAGFRDQSTFATASTAAVQRAPSRRPLLPTPLPPLTPTAAAPGAFSSPRAPPAPRPTSAPRRQEAPRVTLGEFRATSPRPTSAFTSPRPTAAAAASGAAGVSFSTPVPVFTTTGRFPFGFTSVPQTNFAFGNGGSFSFGTGVTSRPADSAAPVASPRATSPAAPPDVQQLTEVSNDVSDQEATSGGSRGQFDRARGRDRVSAATTLRPFSSRTLQPTTPAPSRTVSVSPVSPFVRGPTARPTARPTQAPAEPRRTVSSVAGSFFGANVVPEAATAGQTTRPRGRGRNSFRLNSASSGRVSDDNDINTGISDDADINEIDAGRVEVTTAPPGGRFSATVPTRSPSTRLSGGGAPTTVRPRPSGGGRANFRRRRPPVSATTSGSSAATVGRRRGSSRRRGGSRAQPSAAPATGGNSAASVASSVSPSVTSPSASPSRQPTVSRGSRRPVVARPTPRPSPTRNTPPPAEITNEIDAAPTPKPTRRPRTRGRGSRRFNPRRPGGELNPIRYVRNRGGRGRTAQPTVPPTTTPPPRRFISDIADVEALTDELNLLDEQELLEELEREDRRFRNGPEANNRSIDSGARRQRLPSRGTTPAPLPSPRQTQPTRPAPRRPSPPTQPAPRRPTPPTRPVPRRPTPPTQPATRRPAPPTRPVQRRPTAPPTAAPAPPQIIRKRIRVRGRPSRRPRVGANTARRTTTPRPTTTTTTTTAAPPPPPRPAVTTPPPSTAEASTLPTNKEASNVGRQSGGFFLRPKLQLSSALPTDLQTRRLNDVNALAAERTGRSRNTSPIAFDRAVRSTTRAPDSLLSEILFASSSPGGGRRGDSDYDYQYYDSDFRLEHQDLIEDADGLFQTLSRNTRWT